MASTVSTSTSLPHTHDTLATPFQFIDGYILRSCRTDLTNHTQPISHHIKPLVINALGGGQTHTNTRTKIITRNQACAAFGCAFGLKMPKTTTLKQCLPQKQAIY